MTTSQKTWSALEVTNEDRIYTYQLGYFQARFLNKIHKLILNKFVKESKEQGLTKAILARRLGKSPAQITRWLSAPGNWTLETISDLLLAMNAELDIGVVNWANQPQSNKAHDAVHQVTVYLDNPKKQQSNQSKLLNPQGITLNPYRTQVEEKGINIHENNLDTRSSTCGAFDGYSSSRAAAMAYSGSGTSQRISLFESASRI